MTTGERIRALRKEKGMTQQQLADAMGCTDAAIRNYEADKRTLKGDQLEAMAAALEVAPETLMSLDVDSAREALELLFRLEEEFGLEPAGEGKLAVSGKGKKAPKLAAAIKAWEQQSEAQKTGKITQNEYEAWKRSFGA